MMCPGRPLLGGGRCYDHDLFSVMSHLLISLCVLSTSYVIDGVVCDELDMEMDEDESIL